MILKAHKKTSKRVFWGTTVFLKIFRYSALWDRDSMKLFVPNAIWLASGNEMGRVRQLKRWWKERKKRKGKYIKEITGFRFEEKSSWMTRREKQIVKTSPLVFLLKSEDERRPMKTNTFECFFASSKAMDLGIDHPKLVLGTKVRYCIFLFLAHWNDSTGKRQKFLFA